MADEQKNPEIPYTEQDFLNDYNKLSKEKGFHFNFFPSFYQQDNGSFSIKINLEVIKD